MSNTKTQYEINQERILNHQRIQTGVSLVQTAVMNQMSGTLNGILLEMDEIRHLHHRSIAIQEEILQRDKIQAQMEEFIYTTQKMVAEHSSNDCSLPLSVRYFLLQGVIDTTKQLGIGTPLIRGRDNKAAFEEAMKGVYDLTVRLEKEQEVRDAIAWNNEEEKRITLERQRIEQERQKLNSQRQNIMNELEKLRSSLVSASYFSALSTEVIGIVRRDIPPYDKKQTQKIPLWFWLLGLCFPPATIGFLCQAVQQASGRQKRMETELNAETNAKIGELETRLSDLKTEMSNLN